MSETPHPTDALQDAIDGRLDAEQRAALETHLATCERCRREFEALRWVREQIERTRATGAPADLDRRLRLALDAEDERRASTTSADVSVPRARRAGRWFVGSIAAAAAIAAMIWLGSRPDERSTPMLAAADLRAFQTGALSLERESSDPLELEAHLRATAAPATRVYDFGMMGYTLIGVRTHEMGDLATSLAAYRGAERATLICEMYVGRVETLPTPAERRTHDGVEFLIYRDDEVTVVFWQEGAVVCVLAGDGDPEAIIALAVAKAVKP